MPRQPDIPLEHTEDELDEALFGIFRAMRQERTSPTGRLHPHEPELQNVPLPDANGPPLLCRIGVHRPFKEKDTGPAFAVGGYECLRCGYTWFD